MLLCIAEPAEKVPKLSSEMVSIGSSDVSGSGSSSSSAGSSSTSASSCQSSSDTSSASASASSSSHSVSDSCSLSDDHATARSQVPDTRHMHRRPSPTHATAAVSTLTNTTNDGLIQFAEASVGRRPVAAVVGISSHNSHRVHPYRPAQQNNHRQQPQRWKHDLFNSFTTQGHEPYRSVQDLLQCHTSSPYRARQLATGCASQHRNVLVDLLPSAHGVNGDVDFTTFRFVRCTRETAQKLLGETGVVDDLKDTEFTADDIQHFDHKKRMAQVLDRVLEGAKNNSPD